MYGLFVRKMLPVVGVILAVSLALLSRGGSTRVFPDYVVNSFADLQIDSGGDVYVLRGDGSLEKVEAGGGPVWRVPFAALEQPPAMHPYAFTVSPGGETLVAGVTYRDRRTVIYGVSGFEPVVVPFGEYPGLTPVDLEFSPEGELFLVAYDIDLFNELSSDPSARKDPSSRLLHQLDEEGYIIRSFGRVSYPRDPRELDLMAARLNRKRLVFSPAGKAYFYQQNAPILEEVSLSDGRTIGSTPLPYSGFAAKAIISAVQFVGETEVFYNVKLANEEGLLTDKQVRLLELQNGNSRALASYNPQATGVTATRMDLGRSVSRTFAFDKGNLTLVRETDLGDVGYGRRVR